MRNVAQGNQEAFEELVLRHSTTCIGFCYRLTGDLGLAEEIVQDAFTRLYFARERYHHRAKFTTYFYTIVKNALTDAWRRKPAVAFTSLDQVGYLAVESIGSLPEEHALSRERASMVVAALQQLPEDQRLVIMLREYAGMSYEEIRSVAGLTLGNVKVLMHRGRKALLMIIENGGARGEIDIL